MKNESSKLWLALPVAIAVGVCNIFAFFLFMVLYGHVINPGQDDQFYQDAASRFGPFASIIAGIPIMYFAGRILRKLLGTRALKVGIAAWCIYLAVDIAIVTTAGQYADRVQELHIKVIHILIELIERKLAPENYA